MKGGIGWKLITLAHDHDPWKLYLMFLSQETDLQLCQIYTKINIYIQFCIKVVGLKRSNSADATNLKTMISQRNLIVT